MSLRIFGVLLVLMPLSVSASDNNVNDASASAVCGDLLEPAVDGNNETAILAESHSLLEMIQRDPQKNLAYKHPGIIMGAAQRLLAWIHFAGVRTEPLLYGGGTVDVFPIFSDGLPEVKGRRIVGQEEAIQTLVSYITKSANGDGAASKLLLFVGPPGTGKTEFLTILGSIAETLTATRPEHYMYSYDWHSLAEYPELQPILNVSVDAKGHAHEHAIPCPMHESPFVLLPKAYQDEVVKLAGAKATELSHTRTTPVREPCPHCMHLRDSIIRAHMKKIGVAHLSPADTVKLLSNHVRIKRVIVGRGGTLPKINAEGKDVDYAGLFGNPNAFIINTFGTNHPFSYSLDGKVLRAHGQMLMLDEFLRNIPALRDMFLEIIENKVVVRGGAPSVHLSTVMIGASNNETVVEMLNNPGARAHLDRVIQIPMNYPLDPHTIAKIMLQMKGPEALLQRRLLPGGSQDSDQSTFARRREPTIPANLDDLFPRARRGQAVEGPDHRFDLWFSTGIDGQMVHVSPHAILYMASVAAATRFNTSQADATKVMPNAKVIHQPSFVDHITRLLILSGKMRLQAAEAEELRSLSNLLREGTFGLSARNLANTWLTMTIAEAQRPENGGCVTPLLARRVFVELLEGNKLQEIDNKTRLKWITLSTAIMTNIVTRNIREDVQTALGSGTSAAFGIYDEVFREFLALQEDETAKTYQTDTGQVHSIDFERQREIMALYAEAAAGRAFSPGEVIAFHARGSSMKTDSIRHPGLLTAISQYLAKRVADTISLDDLIHPSQSTKGATRVRARFGEVSRVMHDELGYCDRCATAALILSKQAASGTEQK